MKARLAEPMWKRTSVFSFSVSVEMHDITTIPLTELVENASAIFAVIENVFEAKVDHDWQ